jgi:hypothetical protein
MLLLNARHNYSKFFEDYLKSFFCKYILIFLFAITINATSAYSAYADNDRTTTLKAVTLLNFANYVEPIKQNPVICVIGDDSFFNSLTKVNEIRKGRGKKISLKNIQPSEALGCSLVYISSKKQNNFANLIKTIGSKKIVTASDASGFIGNGGIFELFEDEGRVKFALNLKKTNLNKIIIDSRLIEAADRLE